MHPGRVMVEHGEPLTVVGRLRGVNPPCNKTRSFGGVHPEEPVLESLSDLPLGSA